MELIPIEDLEATVREAKRFITPDKDFVIEEAYGVMTVIPELPYISGIASNLSLLLALIDSKKKMLEGIGILTIRINQLNKMIEEEKQKSVKSDLSDLSDPLATAEPAGEAGSVSPENEKPADTPNAAGSSDNTSSSI